MNENNRIYSVRSDDNVKFEGFQSESQMQSFLMDNPSFLDLLISDAGREIPLIKTETYVKKIKKRGKYEKKNGRIDIVGIRNIDGKNFELVIAELKNGIIDKAAMNQLKGYLDAWDKDSNKHIKAKICNNFTKDLKDEENIEKLKKTIEETKKPKGILIGQDFDPDSELFSGISDNKMILIKLMRFSDTSKRNRLILVDEIFSDVRFTGKRSFISWQDLIDEGIIGDNEKFILSHRKESFIAKIPDEEKNRRNGKFLVFDRGTSKKILRKKKTDKQIKEDFSERHPDILNKWKAWFENELKKFRNDLESLNKDDQKSFSIYAAGRLIAFLWGPFEGGEYTKGQYLWKAEDQRLTIADLDAKCKRNIG